MTTMIVLINLGDVLFTTAFGLLAGLTMKSQRESDAEKLYIKMEYNINYFSLKIILIV